MSELKEFSGLVGNIYDASLDPALWPAVFEQVCRFVRCSSAHLFAQDSVHKTTASRYFTWGDEPEFTQLYIDKYAKLNPMFPGALFFNVEEVHQLIEIIPREEVRRTRFCIEWMAPQEIIDDMFAIRPKISVKTTIVKSGWSTAQAMPSTVCL